MNRRDFIAALVGLVSVPPLRANAQQTRLVAVLMNGNSNESMVQANLRGLADGLSQHGWIEGKNLRLEVRWNGGNADGARTFAAELVGLKPAVIVAASTTNLLAVRNAANTVPIVFLQVSDPVAQGFVQSLTKPGGNATGFSAYEFSIGGKWLDLLKEMSPGVSHVTVMSNHETSPQSKFFIRAIEAVASSFKVRVDQAAVRSMTEIESSIERTAKEPGGGLIIPTDSYTRVRGERIAQLALNHRLPALGAFPEFVDSGGLMYYGVSAADNQIEQFRYAAEYVDRILKGIKPGDLPVQSTNKFVLQINRKTAAALGVDIPPKLLFTADRVVE
jgi:putative ABC transport system substrate-binding protein